MTVLKRKDLLDALGMIDGALAPTADPGINSHFWFTGEDLIAFNGKTAMLTRLRTDFKGAIPRKLAQVLKTSAADDVELTEKEGMLIVRQAKSKVKLPILHPDEWPWTMPALKRSQPVKLDVGRFLQTMNALQASLANITHTIDFLGVNVHHFGTSWRLYASDIATLTYGKLTVIDGAKFEHPETFIIPTAWCKLACDFLKGSETLTVELGQDYLWCQNKAGVVLWSKIIEPDERPMDFHGTIFNTFTRQAEDDQVPIPDEIVPLLERATLVIAKAKQSPRVTVEVKDDTLQVYAISEQGESIEAIPISKGHPNTVAIVKADRMLKACETYSKMVVTMDAVVMTKDNLIHLISGGMD